MAKRSQRRNRSGLNSPWVRAGIVLAVLATLSVAFALLDLDPDLSHVQVKMLSGSTSGNYYAVVNRLATEADKQNGKVENISSRGSLDNLEQLAAASSDCDLAFALAQDGLPWPDEGIELIARLPGAETVFFLGREAAQVEMVADLAGKRIGIGPKGSGTAQLAERLFASRGFSELDLRLENHPIADQMAMVEQGVLDLGMFVIAAQADFIDEAIRNKNLQIASFKHARSIAERVSIVRSEVLPAGYYDPFLVLPQESRNVLVVDTLLLGNGCASRTQTMGMLSLVKSVFPDLVQHNIRTPNQTGLPENQAASTFFANGGPEFLDQYVPWLSNLIPLTNLIQLAMVISIGMNLMTLGHQFRLWRIDILRVSLEKETEELLGTNVSEDIREIGRAEYGTREIEPLDELIVGYDGLRDQVRRHALSWLVPMGQEVTYRLQEGLVDERLTALRSLRERIDSGGIGHGQP